jgi:SAM-dependent methyltransferase
MDDGPRDAATPVVSAFYDRFPYPADALQDGAPPGYNWRWCLDSAFSAVTGSLPVAKAPWRILDAGCGTGVSTDYLAHLNPGSQILAVDISAGTLAVARERLRRSGGDQRSKVRVVQRSLLDLEGEGPFDYINSVGVLHHLRRRQTQLAGSLCGDLHFAGLVQIEHAVERGADALAACQQAMISQDQGPFVAEIGDQELVDIAHYLRSRAADLRSGKKD